MSTLVTKKRTFLNLVLVLVLLVVADGLISQFLAISGLGQETNPFLRIFVGGDRFMTLKIAGGLLAGIVLFDFYRRHPKIALYSTIIFVAVYTAILYWNIAVLFISHSCTF